VILGRYTCEFFFKTPPKTMEKRIYSIKCPPINYTKMSKAGLYVLGMAL
jgi:hypothetical protein